MYSEGLDAPLEVVGPTTAEELLQRLMAGDVVRLRGHTLACDAEAGVVWVTNPYGIDGVMCSGMPELESCRVFLAMLARGEMTGPEL